MLSHQRWARLRGERFARGEPVHSFRGSTQSTPRHRHLLFSGLPLGGIEIKNAADEEADTRAAFRPFQTHQQQIPSLFVHNAILVVSDGLKARVGVVRAHIERFMPWLTIEACSTIPGAGLTRWDLWIGRADKNHRYDRRSS
jgi:hypothetical protein